MKSALLLALSIVLLSSCQKFIEERKEEAAISIVTSGQWKVTSFTKGTENKTALFAPYSFQFQQNETVDAIRNGIVEKTGTWKVNAAAQTITSSFSDTTEPLIYLTGTFKVTNSSSTSVDANQTVNGEVWALHLDKQ